MSATSERSIVEDSPVYPLGSRVNERHHLEVGGCDVIDVAAEFGTPVYIYAEDDIRARARTYLEAFRARTDDFEVLYASKAAPITAIYRLCAEEGLSVDVASGGELHMALAAGIDPARVHMHGNNKTEAELRYAVEARVGHLIVDSFGEIARLDALLDRPQDVLIRVTPGILPSTHSYVQTGGLDSKFGFGLEDGLAARAIAEVRASEHLRLVGLHAHIGSQIFELDPYAAAIEALAALADGDWECRILNVGGGLGIAYTSADRPPSIDSYVEV
jgi:diaminopimelate decarboxylase